MDNTNNNPTSPTFPTPPSPVDPTPPASTWPNPQAPTAAPFPPAEPMPTWPPASQANPVIPQAPAAPTIPIQPEPAMQLPPQMPASTPPFSTQYTDPNIQGINNMQSSSPLDNPYGAPIQPPPFDSGLSAQQNPLPSPVQPDITQSIPQAPEPQIPQQEPAWSPPQIPTEQPSAALPDLAQAPTDLSHLMGNSESTQPPPAEPEIVVVPQMNTPEVPTIPTEGKTGIPKWVIGLGVGLLIVVIGASAYFILGIGQTPKNTSLPAVEPPKVTQQAAPAPVVTPQPQQAATGSANFGELQGSGTAPQASASSTPNSFDRLKARGQ